MTLTNSLRAAIFGAAASVLAFSGMAQGQQEDWNKVIAEAKKEGKLILYTAYVGQKSTKDIAAAFEKKYGIPVEVLEGRAS